jgi:hypothetical protein
MTLDQMLYLVVSDHHDGPLIWEVELSRMKRETVVKEIAEGQYSEVITVIELNVAEGICREVADDADFRAAIDRSADHD